MKKTLLLLLTLSYFISLLWWQQWMYQGSFGVPGLLQLIYITDGEGSYHQMHSEIFLLIFIGLILSVNGTSALVVKPK